MYRNRLYSGVALAAFAALVAVPAQAQQRGDAQAVELETINVEGNGDAQAGGGSGEEKPTVATKQKTVLTTRVTREELDAQQVTDFRDIGQRTPGASFSSSTRSFNIRGLDRNRVLTTIDGIRVPWIEDGARGLEGGIASFELDTLSEIDLVKGSDSTVFGSGALGGVVALRTLDPEDLIEPGKNWGGLSKGGFDSRDNSWRVDQAVAGRVDNTFFMVQGGYRNGHEMDNQGDVGGYGTARTKPDPLDYGQESLLVKLKQHVDGGHVFGLTGELFNRDEDIDNRTASPSYAPGTAFKDAITRRERVSASYTYDGGGFVDAAEAIVYWSRQEIEDGFSANRVTTPVGAYERTTVREEEIYGINGSLLKEFRTGDIDHAVSFGGELFGSRASSFSSGQDNCGPGPYPPFTACNFLHTNQADMPIVDGATLGVFVQDEISFLGDRLRLTPGLRYDWYEQAPQETPGLADNPSYSGTLPDASSDHAFSGKLRAEYDAFEDLTLYAQWAQAFRAPTANELYLTYGAPGTYLRVGNPDLKPETSNGFDVGALVGDDDAGGSIAAFYNRYENFIDDVQRPGPPPPGYPMGVTDTVNRANVEIYGIELSAHYKDPSGWHGWGNFGAYVGEDIDTGEHLNSIPAAKVVVGVGYAADEWGADAILTAAAARNLDDVENADSTTPSYALVDLTAWWSPRQVEGLTIRAGVFNVFDETYYDDTLDLSPSNPSNPRPPKEYFTEPGRNFRVSATYKF